MNVCSGQVSEFYHSGLNYALQVRDRSKGISTLYSGRLRHMDGYLLGMSYAAKRKEQPLRQEPIQQRRMQRGQSQGTVCLLGHFQV